MRLARHHSRRASEAEDLVQDALLAAVAAGHDVDAPASRPWLVGTIRRRGAFVARTAARRRQREAGWTAGGPASDPTDPIDIAAILEGLPPAHKAVMALALSGHSRPEIAYLLRIGDMALRQRISALKRHLAARGIALPERTPGLSLDLDYGRIRDALRGGLATTGGLFASHDPDGHLFIVRTLTNPPAAATSTRDTSTRSDP